MSQRKRLVVAVGVAGLAAAVGLAALAARAATGPAVIRITDIDTTQKTIQPAGGGPVGAMQIVTQRLYNPAISRSAIGHSQLVCTFVDNRNRTCVGTYELPRGSIVVTGTISTRLLYVTAIVGGTGLYDNARGTLTVTASRFRPRHEVLLFRLLG
jgi:hypothetical protein